MDNTIKRIMQEKQKRLGIVGGLGAETSAKLCLAINKKIRELTAIQPDIVLENVPMPDAELLKLLHGEKTENVLEILSKAVKNLNKAGVDFIIIPCNTVHIFIEDLRTISEKPILSIIEETAKKCKILQLKNIGLLASQTAIKNNLFCKVFLKENIRIITPDDKNQVTINIIIEKILNEKAGNHEKTQLLAIIQELKQLGADAVILGCTDLQLLVNKKDAAIQIIDTYKVLEDAALDMLL